MTNKIKLDYPDFLLFATAFGSVFGWYYLSEVRTDYPIIVWWIMGGFVIRKLYQYNKYKIWNN